MCEKILAADQRPIATAEALARLNAGEHARAVAVRDALEEREHRRELERGHAVPRQRLERDQVEEVIGDEPQHRQRHDRERAPAEQHARAAHSAERGRK